MGTHCRARVGCPSLDPTFVLFEPLTSMGHDPFQGRGTCLLPGHQQQTPTSLWGPPSPLPPRCNF